LAPPGCPVRVKPGPSGVSAPRPLRGRKRNSKRHSTTSQSCRYGCKKILRIRASNIDSGSSPDAQCRFKNWFAVIRLLRPRCPPPAFATISASSGHSLGPRGRTGSTGSAAAASVAKSRRLMRVIISPLVPQRPAARRGVPGFLPRAIERISPPVATGTAQSAIAPSFSPRDSQGAG
jgi:hypothetical protein